MQTQRKRNPRTRSQPHGPAFRPRFPSGNGRRLVPSNIRQRVLAKVVGEANGLLRDRGIPEILECTPHTLRRTYISLMPAAGCDPAYVQQQVNRLRSDDGGPYAGAPHGRY